MATTTNFGWETPDDTDLVKDGALAMRTLGNSIDSSMADLKGGTSGQILSKNSNTDMDFTWINNDQGDITAVTAGTGLTGGGTTGAVTVSLDSPVAATLGGTGQTTYATGDLIYSSATNTLSKRSIGTTGQVLTVSGGVPTWSTPASSGGITLIETKTLNNTASTYTFSSIAATYKHLLITGQGVTSATGSSSADHYTVQFNSNTGGNYAYIQVRIIGASVSQTNDSGSTFINAGYAIGHSTATAIDYGQWAMYVYDYASSDSYKSIQYSGGHTSRDDYSSGMGHWNNTNAITSITVAAALGNNFTNGKLKLWGIS